MAIGFAFRGRHLWEILTDGQCIVLSPVREPEEEKTFQAAQEMFHKRFGPAMKRLAR